jgi:hypothetical protein
MWRRLAAYGAVAQLGVLIGVAQPAISDIPDQKTQQGTPLAPVVFQVSGLDTGSALFGVTGTSGNQLLVEDSKIVLQAAGANWSVTVTPIPGQSGKAVITVTATDGVATVSDTFEFFVNSPPRLLRNDGMVVDQGGSVPITPQELCAEDVESPPSQVLFNIAPGGQGGSAHNGQLRLGGQPLLAGQSFTLQDLIDGRLSYTHDGSWNLADDFTFNVTDADGGVTPTGQFTAYTFRIGVRFTNRPPTALSGAASTCLAQTYAGTLAGTDPDPVQTVTFRLLTNGSKGVATITDQKTGAFTYVPNWGEHGEDSFTFTVNDGMADSPSPGTFTITIRPATLPSLGKTFENVVFQGTLGATNPFPPHTLTFRITDSGAKGTAVLADASTGAFTFTPLPGAVGTATITYIANDGYLDSVPGTFALTLWPRIDAGDVLVTSWTNVVYLDYTTGEQVVIAAGGLLRGPRGLALEASGNLVLIDVPAGLIRVNPVTGSQTLVSPGANFSTAPLGPAAIALEANGSILVADGVNGLVRVDPVTGQVTVVAKGGDLGFAGAVIVGAGGEILVGDYSALKPGSASKVLRIDPTSGAQTVISTGGYLLVPAAMAFDADGRLLTTDPGSMVGEVDRVYRVDLATGQQSLLAEGGKLLGSVGIAWAADGMALVTSTKSRAVFRMDPTSGAFTTLTQSNYLGETFGVMVAPPIPLPRPRMVAPLWQAGGFSARLEGLPLGKQVVIEASADLEVWSAVSSSVTTSAEFIYAAPVAAPAQFYRAVLRP